MLEVVQQMSADAILLTFTISSPSAS